MSLTYQQVLPTIVVIVEKPNAPAGMEQGHATYTSLETCVVEASIALIMIDCVLLIREVGNHQVSVTIVVVISKVDAHSRVGVAVPIDRDPRLQTHLFKCPVTFIMKEKLGHGIIGNKDVGPTIAVVVGYSDSERLGRFCQTHLLCDLCKVAIAIIVVHQHGDRFKHIRMAISTIVRRAAPLILPVPMDVAKHD